MSFVVKPQLFTRSGCNIFKLYTYKKKKKLQFFCSFSLLDSPFFFFTLLSTLLFCLFFFFFFDFFFFFFFLFFYLFFFFFFWLFCLAFCLAYFLALASNLFFILVFPFSPLDQFFSACVVAFVVACSFSFALESLFPVHMVRIWWII